MTTQLNESLQYLDMENQVIPILGIDKYKSKIGNDDEFMTLHFTVRSKLCAEDLVNWLERGYDWIIDADNSPGEVATGKYLVFVEMDRRTKAPARIMDMLGDLDTLTDIKPEDWKLNIGDHMYPASEDAIKEHVELSPQQYRDNNPDEESEDSLDDLELNEMRVIAGLEPTTKIKQTSKELESLQIRAGIN